MKNRVHNLSSCPVSGNDTLLLDANIWLALFPPPSSAGHYTTKLYSKSFKRIQSVRAKLVLDVLVLSEYLNRYCRTEQNVCSDPACRTDFKLFRKSLSFPAVARQATAYAKEIAKLCSCHDHLFSSAIANKVFARFADEQVDFNDEMLIEACRQHGWKLVTHDGDFREGGIDVLTHNGKLLAACA